MAETLRLRLIALSMPLDVDASRVLCFRAGFGLEIDHLIKVVNVF
jgi:hypothetical protein